MCDGGVPWGVVALLLLLLGFLAPLYGALLDEVLTGVAWLCGRWASRRGPDRSRIIERWIESKKRKPYYSDAGRFDFWWGIEERPENWRLAPQEQMRHLEACEVAAAIAPKIHEAREAVARQVEKLRGLIPPSAAHLAWRDLFWRILDLEGAFESLLAHPGQALHAAEQLPVLPSEPRTRYPLADRTSLLITKRRYDRFLRILHDCYITLENGVPAAPGVDRTVAAELAAAWHAIARAVGEISSNDVKMRVQTGHPYLHYGGLLAVACEPEPLRDGMREDHRLD